jgi:hypothetical protein
MRLKKYLEEEYFSRSHRWEIFKNPSNSELSKLFIESNKLSGHNSLRFLLTMDKETLYAFPAGMLHGNAALVIDEINSTDIGRDYEDHYYPLEGKMKEGIILMKPSMLLTLSDDQEEELTKVFKKNFNIKIDFIEGNIFSKD